MRSKGDTHSVLVFIIFILISIPMSGQILSAGLYYPINLDPGSYNYHYKGGYNATFFTNHQDRLFVFSFDAQYLKADFTHNQYDILRSREDWNLGATAYYHWQLHPRFRFLPGIGGNIGKKIAYSPGSSGPLSADARRTIIYGYVHVSLNLEFYVFDRFVLSPYIQQTIWDYAFNTDPTITITGIRVGYSFNQ